MQRLFEPYEKYLKVNYSLFESVSIEKNVYCKGVFAISYLNNKKKNRRKLKNSLWKYYWKNIEYEKIRLDLFVLGKLYIGKILVMGIAKFIEKTIDILSICPVNGNMLYTGVYWNIIRKEKNRILLRRSCKTIVVNIIRITVNIIGVLPIFRVSNRKNVLSLWIYSAVQIFPFKIGV